MAESVGFSAGWRHGGPAEGSAHGRAVDEHRFAVDGLPVVLAYASAGPGDVTALRPGAIARRMPHPGHRAAEEEQRPFVEFADPDLPWRYSPGLAGGAHTQPWLLLVVAPAALLAPAGGMLPVPVPVQRSHRIVDAHRWAHVQLTAADGDTPQVARVLAATRTALGGQDLPGGNYPVQTEHVAALVVPWREDGRPAWPDLGDAGAEPVRCLDWWRFRTGGEGTFRTLAEALRHADSDPVGTVQVEAETPDGTETIRVGGALTSIEAPAGPEPASLHQGVVRAPDVGPRSVVGPPLFGALWLGARAVFERIDSADVQAEPAWTWPEQVNADLHRRVAAAVGTRAGIDLQEELVLAANRAWRAGPAAGALLGSLVLGLSASRAGWRRRVEGADAATRLRLLGPALGRLPARDEQAAPGVGEVGTVREALARPASQTRAAYPVELLGPIGRRALRVGGPAARHARDGATDPSRVLPAAAVPETQVPDRPREVPDADAGDQRGDLDPGHVDSLIETLQGTPDLLGTLELPLEIDAIDRLRPAGEPAAPGRPLDLGLLADLLVGALDPTGPGAPARLRVTARLTGVADAEVEVPLEDCPDLHLPAWRYLRDRAPHWLLPGADTLSAGEVASLRTNPEFIEAFLLGLNQQTVSELRWRQHPVRQGCTPLRRFWERYGQDLDTPVDDILGVQGWMDDDGLPTGRVGDHPGDGATPERLVVVVRSDLFRLYPSTLVSLAEQDQNTPTLADLSQRTWPRSITEISDDLTMFAFPDVDPEDVVHKWVVVEEVPDGIRFGMTGPLPAAPDGGAVAAGLLVRPLRVLIRGAGTVVKAQP